MAEDDSLASSEALAVEIGAFAGLDYKTHPDALESVALPPTFWHFELESQRRRFAALRSPGHEPHSVKCRREDSSGTYRNATNCHSLLPDVGDSVSYVEVVASGACVWVFHLQDSLEIRFD